MNVRWLSLALQLAVIMGLGSCTVVRQNQSPPLSTYDKGIGANKSFNVMAPLLPYDPRDPQSDVSEESFAEFRSHLAVMKAMGVDGVSTDIWWGLVEKEDNKFDFSYYERIVDAITTAGLEWVPILSFHQCGGNVGDSCDVPIPQWIFTKGAVAGKDLLANDLKYKSEQGNFSSETVSAWGSYLVLEDYREFMAAFQERFANRRSQIQEINISLGPAGELRYPSYNSHDEGTNYPTRGGLQAYSKMAVADFQKFVVERYGNLKAIRQAWGRTRYVPKRVSDIKPPVDADRFFEQRDHQGTTYGRDFFDWYRDSLIRHGDRIMTAAIETFTADNSAFRGIALGAKIPGIHWRIGSSETGELVLSDRLAELNAGLIGVSRADWERDQDGRGYRPLIALFRSLGAKAYPTPVNLHFTCLEMDDNQDPDAQSMAKSLVRWVGQEAKRQSVPIKGENALGWNVPKESSWDHMASHMAGKGNPLGYYDGLTILRMSDVAASAMARERYEEIIRRYR